MITSKDGVRTRPKRSERLDDAIDAMAIEALRQEAFELYVAVRAAQRASDRHQERAEALRGVALLNKRIADNVRALRVETALEYEDDGVVGAPI